MLYSQIIELGQEQSSKKKFSGQIFKNWGTMTSLIWNANVTELWLHNHIYNITWVIWLRFFRDVLNIIYDDITFLLKHIYFKKV